MGDGTMTAPPRPSQPRRRGGSGSVL